MKTIVLATDCKEHSVPALKYAYFLSNNLNASLVVLHVYDIPVVATSRSSRSAFKIKGFSHQEHLEVLKSFCSVNLGNELDRMNIRTDVVENISVANGILAKSKELMADLVIVGTKNKDSRRGLLAGNIAKTLTGKLSCPILVLPNIIKIKKPETIVYATDFEEEDIYAIKKLVDIIDIFKTQIRVVHISPQSEYSGYDQMEWFKEMLFQKVSYENISFQVFFSDNILEELNKHLINVDADMITMLEREDRGFFRRVMHRDLVKKMESQNTFPLLCFTKTM